MKKLAGFFILVSIISCSTVPNSQRVEEVDPLFVMWDVLFYRPVGLVATVIGAGTFIATSPFTAFASIPEPHDAFEKTGNILILSPINYTFVRPIGDRSFPYAMGQYQYRPAESTYYVKPFNMSVQPEHPPVLPRVPDEQSPLPLPDRGL